MSTDYFYCVVLFVFNERIMLMIVDDILSSGLEICCSIRSFVVAAAAAACET